MPGDKHLASPAQVATKNGTGAPFRRDSLLQGCSHALPLASLYGVCAEVGPYATGANADYPDTLRLEFEPGCFTDCVKRVLCGGVCAHVRDREMSDHAGDVDDRASALSFEKWRHRLNTFDRTEQIGLEHSPALFHRHGGYRIEHAVTGIVDPNVDPPEMAFGCAHQRIDLTAVADIAGNGCGAFESANSVSRFLNSGQFARTQDDSRAFLHESLGNGLADSHRRAGDCDYLVLASHKEAFSSQLSAKSKLNTNYALPLFYLRLLSLIAES